MNSFSRTKTILLSLLLLCCVLKMSSLDAQINKLNSLIEDSTDYNFTKPIIFRTGLHFPFGFQPFVSGEIKLLKRFTLNMEIGTSLKITTNDAISVTNPAEIADKGKIGFSGFISPELRYYYNKPVGRTPKTNMPIRGFSGGYVALKYFASTKATTINRAAEYTYENISAWQMNLGGQYQFNDHGFFGIYGGLVLGSQPIQSGKSSTLPLFQFGLTIGYIF